MISDYILMALPISEDVLCWSVILVTFFLGFLGAPLWLWTAWIAALLFDYDVYLTTWYIFSGVAILLNVSFIRRYLISIPIAKTLKALKFLPVISETEKIAIEAGTVWVDGELFSGKPDFHRCLKESYPVLKDEEKAFIEGPVEDLCAMTSEFEINQNRDLPKKVWDYLKSEKFFGMIIPKEYGGLGFSANAHSAVIAKLSSRSTTLGITTMVPNSLGPAELLIHYGTDEQKDYYLPRLAVGDEIPCFGLTEPGAGSDAGAIQSSGEVIKGDDGKLYMKLNWNKRWITLAGISTVIGLAFKLKDPNNYLEKGEDLGITCALIPAKMEGVVLGKRHDPLGVPFFNCPTLGKDVMVSVDTIIGGVEYAGKGWQMLMGCLAAGRGISLPANSTGGAKAVTRIVSAYASVRKQFGMNIGKFEGIEEPLARISGFNYLMEATRNYTCGGLDSGQKPPVITAIAKYNFTELFRKIINDAMDLVGGAAITRGPKNMLASAYIATPIGITVEGANILTRTLMVFGQGAIRCHPFAKKEIQALETNDWALFDKAFFGHIGHVIRNVFRSVGLSLTRGRLAKSPVSGPMAKYYRKLSWASASFALLSDIALGTLGGDLKRKEKITGRFADIISWMYIALCIMRRYRGDGRKREDLPFAKWGLEYAFFQMQVGFDGLFENMGVLYKPLALWSRLNRFTSGPSDSLGSELCKLIQEPGDQRDRLTKDIFVPKDDKDPHSYLEKTFVKIKELEPVEKKIKQAIKAKRLPKQRVLSLLKSAVDLGIISEDEAKALNDVELMRDEAIQVDSFTIEDYKKGVF